MTINFLFFLVISFFLGGVPFGLIIGKIFKKRDIRYEGSGNIGATNVARVLGIKYAVITFILDGLKTFIPVFIAKSIFNDFAIFVAFFSIIGHIFSPFLKGRGGKGISSTIFALLAIDYRLFIIMVFVWILCFKLTKISALSALLSIFLTSIFSYFITSKMVFLVIFVLTIVIFFAHRKNIIRLIKCEELGFKNNNN